jgi:hypothetical protein
MNQRMGNAQVMVAFVKDHPEFGSISRQDHRSPCWCQNIKLLPLAR